MLSYITTEYYHRILLPHVTTEYYYISSLYKNYCKISDNDDNSLLKNEIIII